MITTNDGHPVWIKIILFFVVFCLAFSFTKNYLHRPRVLEENNNVQFDYDSEKDIVRLDTIYQNGELTGNYWSLNTADYQAGKSEWIYLCRYGTGCLRSDDYGASWLGLITQERKQNQ